MLLNLKPGDLLQFWLFIGLFIGSLNNMNNNLVMAGFFWVPKLVLHLGNTLEYSAILVDPRNTNHICYMNNVTIDSCEMFTFYKYFYEETWLIRTEWAVL